MELIRDIFEFGADILLSTLCANFIFNGLSLAGLTNGTYYVYGLLLATLSNLLSSPQHTKDSTDAIATTKKENAYDNLQSYDSLFKALTLGAMTGFARLWYTFLLTHASTISWVEWIWSVPVGILFGDFVSGIMHWMGDTVSLHSDFYLIQFFRLHHDRPQDMLKNSNWALSYDISLISLVLLYLSPQKLWLHVAAVAGCFCNITHKYTHMRPKDVPPLIRMLQDRYILLNRREHRLHHIPPYKSHYCTLTGWSNLLLDPIDFWVKLERYTFGLVWEPKG